MNFLVVSRLSIPAKDRTLPAWEHLRSLGHTVTVEHPGDAHYDKCRPDVLVSMGISIMEETFRALELFPGVPLFAYNWDCYEWVWEPGHPGTRQAHHAVRNQGQQREYDYVRYGELLRRAREVWVPSACTGRRTEQWWGLRNWAVVRSACPWWDPAPGALRDGGYALMTLREIPDPWWGVFERCCSRLGIPFVAPYHAAARADYEAAVAGCRFICAPLYELSTGGLTLLEAYRLGKPVLLSDSPWNGGRDYFGDRARYFRHGDEADFERALRGHWAAPPAAAPDQREWVEANFSDRRMVEDMLARVGAAR